MSVDGLTDDLRLRFFGCGRTDLSTATTPPVYTRPFTVVSTIAKGDVCIEFQAKSTPELTLQQGDVCVLPLNVRRHARALSKQRTQSLTAGYLFEVRGGLDLMHFLDLPPAIKGNSAKAIADLLNELYEREHDDTEASGIQRSVLQQRIGYALLEVILSVSGLKEGALSMRRILPVVEHISRHLSEPLDLPVLIRQTGLSRTHFFRLFKTWTGTTPIEFLKQQRIREATALLMEGGQSVAEIGYTVGYSDPFFFSKVFKSVTGLSPKLYREEQGGI